MGFFDTNMDLIIFQVLRTSERVLGRKKSFRKSFNFKGDNVSLIL